ncbi:hypothetical protein C8J57DRAFT_956023, partial [Mycena rebaudengoi]
GITGYLRQEFRELELLNEIIQAKYMSLLPLSVTGVTQSELLRTYQEYQGSDYNPVELHSALQWHSGDAPKIPAIPIVGQWSLVGKDLEPAKSDEISDDTPSVPSK